MATEKQQIEFINAIAPLAQKAYKELGKVYPSICIAMACVECGYGTAGSVKHHSYIGQKVGSGKTAKKYWDGKFFNSKTKEEYTVGIHTTIVDAFRAYDSMEQCVFNYYELLNSNVYAKVTADVDYETQMKQIKACGYMTSSTEVNSVLTIIRKFDLTKYDKNDKPKVSSRKEYEMKKSIKENKIDVDNLPILKLYSNDKDLDGNYVASWQTFLSQLGFYKGAIDGVFSTQTHFAVREYQEYYNREKKPTVPLKIDGIVGKKTWATLNF